MQFKDKLLNIGDMLNKYFAVPFCLSVFAISITISVFRLRFNNFSDSFVLYTGLIFGFLAFFLWFKKLDEENKIRKLIVKFCLPLFLLSLLIITIHNLNFLTKFDLHLIQSINPHLVIIVIMSGFITFYVNREKVEQEINRGQDDGELTEQKYLVEFSEKFSRIKKIPILRNVAKWMHKEGWKYSIGLLLVIIFGFILRFLGALWGNINLDEGIHLYDAKLLTEGFVPFRDYFTREPYYIYLLSFLVKIFGANLLTSRLLSVIASSLAIPVIYLLGKNIFSKRIGFIAAIFFALSPFVINETYLGNLYGVYPLITALVFLSFSNLLKNINNKTILTTGFLLGLAVHFYRLTVFCFPIVGLILGFIAINKNVKIRHLFFFCLSTAIPFFTPIIYFSLISGYHNFETIYGANELIIAFLSLPFGFLSGVILNKLWQKYKEKGQIITSCSLLLLLIFSIYSFLNIGIQPNYKGKILFDALLQSWHLIFFVLVALIIYLKKIIFTNLKLFFTLKIIFLGLMLYLAYYGTTTAQNLQIFGARIIPIDLKNIFLLFYSLSIIFLFFLNQKLNFKSVNFQKDTIYWWLLFFAPATFYLIQVQIFSNIFLSFIVLGCIMTALGFDFLTKIFQTSFVTVKISLILMLVGFLLAPIYLYSTVSLRERMWPQEARIEIGNYIKENTQEKEEIFTNAIIFVVENNRRVALNLSRSTIYATNDVYMPDYTGSAKNLVSSIELANYIKTNVNLILIDNRTVNLFKNNQDFTNIKQYYYLDKKWPQYEIEAWKKIN